MIRHVILRALSKLLIPLIMLFALYVQFHGDYGPGGGFQAGVIFGASIILYTLMFGLDRARRVFPPRVLEIFVALVRTAERQEARCIGIREPSWVGGRGSSFRRGHGSPSSVSSRISSSTSSGRAPSRMTSSRTSVLNRLSPVLAMTLALPASTPSSAATWRYGTPWK